MSALRENACHVCSSNIWEKAFQVTDTNQGVPGHWWILVCRKCGLGVIDAMPDNEEIASYYLENFYAADSRRFRPIVEKTRSVAAWFRGRTLRRLMPRGGVLLDFGAGTGHFGESMRKAGWEVASVDLATNASDTKDVVHFTMTGDSVCLNFPDASFDAVTLWYVIEHLRNPRIVLEEMKRILKPGGILLLAQQNFESYQSRFFKGCWLILDPPRHLYQFSPRNLIDLIEQVGLRCMDVKSASLEMGPFTILQSSLNLILGNGNYLFRFLKHRKLRFLGTDAYSNRKMVVLSLCLSIILGPLSLITYYILLAVRSGDVFTVYARK